MSETMHAAASESVISTLDVLLAARKLIEKPENWTQYAFARDAQGQPTIDFECVASAWCAEGAIFRAYGESYASDAFDALERMAGTNVYDFNDSHTPAEVLALFDRAIEDERMRAPRTEDAIGTAQRE